MNLWSGLAFVSSSDMFMQYEPGSAPALALQATMDRTHKRFENYAKSGVLCGSDGLPHLIADPGLALRYGHAGEIFVRFLISLAAQEHNKQALVTSTRHP
jgi:hypothetical protein